ncbi:MAG: hypothetical protein H7067_10800 [Burkholderiales bacterium]|nr:hypothetical protein [Opitutaceae bacterium]
MQTQLHLSSALAVTSLRFVPPAHVKRWTGRAVPTIRLPDLAALRIAGSSLSRHGIPPARA